jgi:hypothetical protein
MGRRKKETGFSYVDIVISTYVKNNDYTKAQLAYSNNLKANGTLEPGFKQFVELDLDEFDESDDD